MTEIDFLCSGKIVEIKAGSIKVSAPSNIALVKYWGKKAGVSDQIPANPSISFTLKNCKTTTTLGFKPKTKVTDFEFDLFFEGQPKLDFRPKIEKFLQRIEKFCPYLKQYRLLIDTQNTFPHSSGIASSASGMAALSVAIMQLEKILYPEIDTDFLNKKASFLARLGSGSACRSVLGKIVVWGKNKSFENSSDLFGVEFDEHVHESFNNFQDTILLVDKGEKTVSSTVGHDLMHNHPFAERRFEQAHENLAKLKNVLQSGDLQQFIEIVESEALTLHAMMQTSIPYFILMKPNTLEIINRIWKFRTATKTNVCFTLDAGANVHVLYPFGEKEKVLQFIKDELVGYCQNGHYICDEIGGGAMVYES